HVSSVPLILKDKQLFFASYVVSGKVLPSGGKFFISFSNSSNPLSNKPFDAFHCNNSNVVPNFFWSFCNQGTTMFCSPPTYASDLSIPFLFRNLPQLRAASDQDHLLQRILQYLLQAHPLQCHLKRNYNWLQSQESCPLLLYYYPAQFLFRHAWSKHSS